MIDYFESKIGIWKLKPRTELVISIYGFLFIYSESKRAEIKPQSKFDCLQSHIFYQICRLIYISRQSNFGTVFTQSEQQHTSLDPKLFTNPDFYLSKLCANFINSAIFFP